MLSHGNLDLDFKARKVNSSTILTLLSLIFKFYIKLGLEMQKKKKVFKVYLDFKVKKGHTKIMVEHNHNFDLDSTCMQYESNQQFKNNYHTYKSVRWNCSLHI